MKSYESDLADLAEAIYKDAAAQCAVENSDVLRDLMTIRSRVQNEGLSFLTITLPSFGADFESVLRDGVVGPTHFQGFRKCGRAPAFLRGFLGQILDSETGDLLQDPSPPSVKAVRQIAFAFKKMKMLCSADKVEKALEDYCKDERIFEKPLHPEDIDSFLSVSKVLWTNVFRQDVDPERDLIPKHGPGATAEKLSGNQKFRCSRWHDRLESCFPSSSFLTPNWSVENVEDGLKDVSIVPECEEQPVRVIPVPKTQKKPRIIAIEPVCMQYTQQSVKRVLYDTLESHPLTAGHVNFTDQHVNRRLAMIGSKTGRLATLDLSAASDRVPHDLAMRMFDAVPVLQECIEATRSSRAQMPNGDVIHLKKFASMGSALCFPIEAMYFYTICIVALLESAKLPVTFLNVRKVAKKVYVYGDDIIVPADQAAIVTRTLEKYYAKVNVSKSFWTGRFRESCGMDAYAGEDVTPVYIRRMNPRHKGHASELVSWISTGNQFYQTGYWLTAAAIKRMVEKILGKLPIIYPTSPGLGWYTFQRVPMPKARGRYQRPENRTWVSRPVYRTDVLDGVPALTKTLLILGSKSSSESLTDRNHLSESPRHGAVTLKRRWTSPY